MATYLTLEGAKILEARGFGSGTPSSGLHTIKFEDVGVFSIYYKGLFGGLKKLYWSSFGKLEFFVGTVGVQTGGGWIGGGIGVGGAIRGAMTASVLNALTTQNREYAVLTVFDHDLESGAYKSFSLGFLNIGEAELRNRLAEMMPDWTEPLVLQLKECYDQITDKDDAFQAIEVITGLGERGIISQDQADRIFEHLREVAPEAFPKPALETTSLSRIEQLKILSDLRSSGALSEEEFQAEKRLLLV